MRVAGFAFRTRTASPPCSGAADFISSRCKQPGCRSDSGSMPQRRSRKCTYSLLMATIPRRRSARLSRAPALVDAPALRACLVRDCAARAFARLSFGRGPSCLHRYCLRSSVRPKLGTLAAFAPPLVAVCTARLLVPWAFMWLMAGALFLAFKWLTFVRARKRTRDITLRRALAWFFLWPGMDAGEFFQATQRPPLSRNAASIVPASPSPPQKSFPAPFFSSASRASLRAICSKPGSA